MTLKKTVVEVTEVSVDAPLVDRARAWKNRLGVFSKFSVALEWLSRQIEEHGPGEPGGLLYYRFDGILLDVELRRAHTMVFSRDDKRRGIISGDEDKPWTGRSPEDCRYKPGDLVGFISNYEPAYRIGVILRQPPAPGSVRGGLTVADDTPCRLPTPATARPGTTTPRRSSSRSGMLTTPGS
jgi:hypothetical protein